VPKRSKHYTPKAEMRLDSLARCFTEQAIKTLSGISKDGTNESARVAAATALLDRGWGKPEQYHKHTGMAADGSHIFEVRHIYEGKPKGEK
jgi:hypothetical protein